MRTLLEVSNVIVWRAIIDLWPMRDAQILMNVPIVRTMFFFYLIEVKDRVLLLFINNKMDMFSLINLPLDFFEYFTILSLAFFIIDFMTGCH